jgi:ribosomal protein L37AE/L43A
MSDNEYPDEYLDENGNEYQEEKPEQERGELKPCPFCGSADIRTEPGINLNYCDKCSAEANIEHWNTRPIEDALNKRIAELEAEIERLTVHSDTERQDDKWIPEVK